MSHRMFNVGKVINTHGIKGEVKVHRITDFEDRFQIGQQLYWKNDGGEATPLTIRSHRVHKGFDLIGFEEYESINDVERLKNGMLMISEEQQESLDEHEYYFHEIIGCHVYTLEGEEIGTIREILTPGANDVWVIKRKGKSDALVPYIESVVKEVDPDEKKVIIDPIEGLLD